MSATVIGRVKSGQGKSYEVKWDQSSRDVYPPSQKAPSGRAGMNAKRVSTVALAKVDLLRRVPPNM